MRFFLAPVLCFLMFMLSGCEKEDPVLNDIKAFDALGPSMFLDMHSGETLMKIRASETDDSRRSLLDEQILAMDGKLDALSRFTPKTETVQVLVDEISHGLKVGTAGAKAARDALDAKDQVAFNIAIQQMLDGQTEVVRGGYAFMALARTKDHALK